MKKILTCFIFILLISSLIACSNLFDNSPKVEVEIDFSDYSIKSISNNLEANVNLLPNFISLDIKLDSETSSHGLKVNGKNIDKNKYSINNNTLIYNFKAIDFLNADDTLTTLVKLDANGGLWHKEQLINSSPDFEFIIESINDEQTTNLTIFTNKTTGLRWHHKLFIKFDEALDAYKVIYADPQTASIENLNVSDYDFIIGLHYHNTDLTTNPELKALFTSASVNRAIILDKALTSLSTPVQTNIYSNTPNADSYQMLLNDETILPTPIREAYEFLGWSDGNHTTQTFKPLKVKDDTYIQVYTAQYSGLSISNLDKYLKSLIPTFIEGNITLPTSYSDYTIVWESSNEAVLSPTGKFTNSFNDPTVTLTANITKTDGSKYKYTYEANVMMMKSLENGVAGGYIYRGYDTLPDMLFEGLDLINTAFIDIDTNGNLNGTALLSNVETYVMPRAKKSGSYVILVIGPASTPSIWSQVARDPNKINNMANQIVEVINTYGFHGVDIDWEWPSVSEKTNFTALMKVIYEKVKQNNPNHIVTAAIAGGQWQMPNYDLPNSGKYIDYVNMMTYGLVNNGGRYQNPLKRATTWHNTTYNLGATTSSTSIEESIALFNNYGIPNQKIIIGLAFYGIRHSRTKNTDNTFTDFKNAGSVYYSDIIALMDNPNYTYAYDERAGVPYIYKNDGTEFISFDDPRSINEKVQYQRRYGLAGMMFWEYGTDSTNTLLKALKEAMYK